jgi:hypothetical protein
MTALASPLAIGSQISAITSKAYGTKRLQPVQA